MTVEVKIAIFVSLVTMTTATNATANRSKLPASSFLTRMHHNLKDMGAYGKKPIAVIYPKDKKMLPGQFLQLKCMFTSVNSTEIIWLKNGVPLFNESQLIESKSYRDYEGYTKRYRVPVKYLYSFVLQQLYDGESIVSDFTMSTDSGIYQCQVPDTELRPGAMSPAANITVYDWRIYGPTTFLQDPKNRELILGKRPRPTSCKVAGINVTSEDIILLHNGRDVVGNSPLKEIYNGSVYIVYKYEGFEIAKFPNELRLYKDDIKWSDAGEYQCMVPEKNGQPAVYSQTATITVSYDTSRKKRQQRNIQHKTKLTHNASDKRETDSGREKRKLGGQISET